MTNQRAKLLVLDDHRLFVDSIKVVLQQMKEVGQITASCKPCNLEA